MMEMVQIMEKGEMVTSENLDVEILKKFGAKIPALNNVNLNDPVARQTVAQCWKCKFRE